MARETSTRGCGCGVLRKGFVASLKLCRTRELRFSSSCSVVTSKTLRGVYFWWNYAKGIVKTSEEGRRLTSIYDTSDINAPVDINAMYTRRVAHVFSLKL